MAGASAGAPAASVGAARRVTRTCSPFAVWMVAPVAMPTRSGPPSSRNVNRLRPARLALVPRARDEPRVEPPPCPVRAARHIVEMCAHVCCPHNRLVGCMLAAEHCSAVIDIPEAQGAGSAERASAAARARARPRPARTGPHGAPGFPHAAYLSSGTGALASAGRAAQGTRVQIVNKFWSAPQQQHERDGGLGQRKLVADAFAHAAAEGDERKVGRDLVRVQAGALRLGPVARPRAAEVRVGVCLSKPLRPERVGVAPQVRRPARAALACYRVATGGGVWEDLGRTGK